MKKLTAELTDGTKITLSAALELISNHIAHHLARAVPCGRGQFCIHRSSAANYMNDMALILENYRGADRDAWLAIAAGYGEMYAKTTVTRPHLRLVK
jgi:hypothetical protein